MPQVTGTMPPAYSNFVTGARKKKKAANPFPLAGAIQAAAKSAPPLPPLRKAPRSRAQDAAIFAKTKGRGK